MKQSPYTPPHRELSNGTKNAYQGTHDLGDLNITNKQTKQNKTKQNKTIYLKVWTSVPYAIATVKIKVYVIFF